MQTLLVEKKNLFWGIYLALFSPRSLLPGSVKIIAECWQQEWQMGKVASLKPASHAPNYRSTVRHYMVLMFIIIFPSVSRARRKNCINSRSQDRNQCDRWSFSLPEKMASALTFRPHPLFSPCDSLTQTIWPRNIRPMNISDSVTFWKYIL